MMLWRILIAAWLLYLSAVALLFLFPGRFVRILNTVGFSYYLPLLVVASGAYGISILYRAGMSKASHHNRGE